LYATCFTVAEYAELPLIPPFLQPGNPQYYNGVNFASSGAGALVQTFQGEVRAFHIRKKQSFFFSNFFFFKNLILSKWHLHFIVVV